MSTTVFGASRNQLIGIFLIP